MTIDEIVRDIHALEADLENYECKYTNGCVCGKTAIR